MCGQGRLYLRDMYTYGIISLDEVQDFLKDILVIEGKMYLQNIEVAEWFVETYYKEVIDFFMDPLNVYAYDMLAKTLKRSLEKNILNVNDFLKRDGELLNKIKASNDKELLSLLRKLNSDVEVIEDRENYELHRKNKLRMIDPSILKDGDLISASRLSEKVRILGEVAYEKATRGMYVKIISN